MVPYDRCWNNAHAADTTADLDQAASNSASLAHFTSRGCSSLRISGPRVPDRLRHGKTGVQRVMLKQCRVYEESGVSMLPIMMLLMPFVQFLVTLVVCFGVRKLYTLPLEQLHWSGVSILPDLTVADPLQFYVLPISATVFMNVQLKCVILMAHMECPFFVHAEVHHRLVQANGCDRGLHDCNSRDYCIPLCLGHLYPVHRPIPICVSPLPPRG